MTEYYHRVYNVISDAACLTGYLLFDIDEIIYADTLDLDLLNYVMDVKMDIGVVKEYRDNNTNMLDQHRIDPSGTDAEFFGALCNFVSVNMAPERDVNEDFQEE